jgi:hypothetical protein
MRLPDALHFSQQLYAHALTLQEVIRNGGGVTYEVLRPRYDRQAAQQFEVFHHSFKKPAAFRTRGAGSGEWWINSGRLISWFPSQQPGLCWNRGSIRLHPASSMRQRRGFSGQASTAFWYWLEGSRLTEARRPTIQAAAANPPCISRQLFNARRA